MDTINITISVDLQIKVPRICNKYIISRTNFSKSEAYVLGVPLRVISNPYFDEKDNELTINVVSLITGQLYRIPFATDWFDIYEDFSDLLYDCQKWVKKGYTVYQNAGRIEQIINKDYYPIDNSWSADFDGNRMWIANSTWRILSVPFKVETEFGDRKCILLQCRGDKKMVGRGCFMENCLI